MTQTANNAVETKADNMREAGLMTTTGVQGVGKTYQNMKTIALYLKDKPHLQVRGRKVLIFDTNGEYTQDHFKDAGHLHVAPKLIRIRDVKAFGYSDLIECRRIDAKNLGISEKTKALEYILANYRNGLLVIEDINTYILQVTHMSEIVGRLVNLRHRATDVLISYQSLRPVEPRIWQNSRWIRMHFQSDMVESIKDKITNLELFKIAEIMVRDRYMNGDRRFFVYITDFGQGIEGAFKKEEYMEAARRYLKVNKQQLQQFMAIYECPEKEAVQRNCDFLYQRYYRNPDRQLPTDAK